MHEAVISWYAEHARDLPWRRADRRPWGVLVSEVMLQQTPVARVLPVWHTWMARWPTPRDLADEQPGEAIRAWGRLGYPRRALRLHAAARTMVERHQAQVPSSYDELRALPGIGDYTAAAVAVFAFGQRHPVLDTNVRRVLARAVGGTQYAPAAATAAEGRSADALLPESAPTAAVWSVAVMELGALVCTSRSPACRACPISASCAWRVAGFPPHAGAPRRAQTWHGTDRQARGSIMAALRASDSAVPVADLATAWADAPQRDRSLAGLLADGLVELTDGDRVRLPAGEPVR